MPTKYDLLSQPQPQHHMMQMDPYNQLAYPQGGIQINPTFVIGDHNKLPAGTNENSIHGGDENSIDHSQGDRDTPTVGFNIKESGGGGGGGGGGGDISTQEKEKVNEQTTTTTTPSSNSFFDFLKINKIMS